MLAVRGIVLALFACSAGAAHAAIFVVTNTAILLNTPGEAASVATTLSCHPPYRRSNAKGSTAATIRS